MTTSIILILKLDNHVVMSQRWKWVERFSLGCRLQGSALSSESLQVKEPIKNWSLSYYPHANSTQSLKSHNRLLPLPNPGLLMVGVTAHWMPSVHRTTAIAPSSLSTPSSLMEKANWKRRETWFGKFSVCGGAFSLSIVTHLGGWKRLSKDKGAPPSPKPPLLLSQGYMHSPPTFRFAPHD